MTTYTQPCQECGMPVALGEYHPFAACLMFKGCHNSETVRANLKAVTETWFEMGRRQGLEEAKLLSGQKDESTENHK